MNRQCTPDQLFIFAIEIIKATGLLSFLKICIEAVGL